MDTPALWALCELGDLPKMTSSGVLWCGKGKEKSIRLHKEKVALRVQKLDFMGHQLTAQGLKPDPGKVEAILKLETPKTKEDIEKLSGTVKWQSR